MGKELSIYIHIPFCDSKCYYCSFCSSVENDKTKEKYFTALENEIKSRKKDFNSDEIIKTIYFGGGTPSIVKPELINSVLQTLKKHFKVLDNAEITIECNPNSTTQSKLEKYKEYGINRLSFGVQSFNKRALKFVGRIKSEEELKNYKTNVFNCLKTAKNIGFDNVSVDFILGLPHQSNFQLKSFLNKVSKYATHFSCYMLQIEEDTKLAELLPNGVSEEKLIEQYEIASKTLKKLGFERYEISNFAKKGKESKHNKGYWERADYIGFGLAAHSLYNNARFANTENLKEYLEFWQKINKNTNLEKMLKKQVITAEKLSKKECAEETLMLSLRTIEGLNLVKFKENYFDLEKYHAKKIAMMLKNGLITLEGDFLRLTGKGLLVANEIIVNFADDFVELIEGAT